MFSFKSMKIVRELLVALVFVFTLCCFTYFVVKGNDHTEKEEEFKISVTSKAFDISGEQRDAIKKMATSSTNTKIDFSNESLADKLWIFPNGRYIKKMNFGDLDKAYEYMSSKEPSQYGTINNYTIFSKKLSDKNVYFIYDPAGDYENDIWLDALFAINKRAKVIATMPVCDNGKDRKLFTDWGMNLSDDDSFELPAKTAEENDKLPVVKVDMTSPFVYAVVSNGKVIEVGKVVDPFSIEPSERLNK